MSRPSLIFLFLVFALLKTAMGQSSPTPTASPSPTPLHTEIPKKFSRWPDRKKIEYYDQSSPELKPKLAAEVATAEWRLKCGGKRGYLLHQQRRAIQARGLGDLLRLSELRLQLWDAWAYASAQEIQQLNASTQPYQPTVRAQANAQAKAIQREHAAVDHRYWKTIWPLLLHLAPSPPALQLNAKAAAALKIWDKNPNFSSAALKVLLIQLDQQADTFIQEMQNLPALSLVQLKQEIASLPQEAIQH